MKYIAAALVFATAVAGHGYVNNATIGDKEYTFYQPYQDPYMNPKPERISREIQGNGPVEDVTSPDLQCGGYCKNIRFSHPLKIFILTISQPRVV